MTKQTQRRERTKKGIALISVLAMVTLATVIVLALFSMSDTEFKSSKVYAGANAAKQLADTSVDLVIGQIRSATIDPTSPNAARIWASQPGAIRVYGTSGAFTQGFKLYSDSTMVVNATGVAGDTAISGDAPAATWNTTPEQYVDLNEPVVRVDAGGGISRVFFPVVDPRAAENAGSTMAVEGFSYSAAGPSGGNIAGVVAPGAGGGDSLRLPMPVEWLYLLRDGNVGTVTAAGMWSGGVAAPSEDNPIIGRVAFWTDDESSKVNINTASEPGYWATPTFFHERDKGWADSPPTLNEYQRFPGHPATVALSTVLYPAGTGAQPKIIDAYSQINKVSPSSPPAETALAIKSRIYTIAPKINLGGSQDGTLAFAADDLLNNISSPVSILASKRERLFASLDELIFSQNMAGRVRQENDFNVLGLTLLTKTTLERSRFFMTAHSRAPELNLFNRPRVAMWPIPDKTLGPDYRTGYDGTIASVSTLSSNINSTNTYYFSRKNADSAIQDIGKDHGGAPGLMRNANLLTYLDKLLESPFPGGASFHTKYGVDDSRQILTQVFDYIRSTNTYDSFLAPEFKPEATSDEMDFRDGGSATDPFNNTGGSKSLSENLIWGSIPQQADYKTYTEPRFKVRKTTWWPANTTITQNNIDFPEEIVASGAYPGHGQVTPSEWEIGGKTYRGFGRFATISEIGLQFICTADGKNDSASADFNGVKSGGKTAERIDPSRENERVPEIVRNPATGISGPAYWYSNIPPRPSAATFRDKWGCNMTDTRSPAYVTRHPGADSSNWNFTLPVDTPLKEDEKRIQMAINLEFFVPSVGWTKYAPEFTVVLRGEQLSALKVRNAAGQMESVFNTNGDQVLKSNMSMISNRTDGLDQHYGIYPLGSTQSVRATTLRRRVKGVAGLPNDPGYDSGATSKEHAQIYNYPLVSSCFTVSRDNPLTFTGGPITIDIYADHDWQGKQPTQTIEINIPDGSAPSPELVRYSTQKRRWDDANGNIYTQRAIDAVRWWAFNYGGAVGRYTGLIRMRNGAVDYSTCTEVKDPGERTRGRFEGLSHATIDPQDDEINGIKGSVPAGSLFYGYSALGGYTGTKARASDQSNIDEYVPQPGKMGRYGFYGSDTVRSLIPKYGDYRIIAARKVVPSSMFVTHPLWDDPESFFAHNFTSFFTGSEVGFAFSKQGDQFVDSANRLVKFDKQTHNGNPNADKTYNDYRTSFVPDMPPSNEASSAAQRYGDFDNGPGNCRDGSYINKADEGNLSVVNSYLHSAVRRIRNSYFQDQWMQLPANESFFTPNRMIASSGVLGSLPTGVFGGQSRLGAGESQSHGEPWRTLLFRPNLGSSTATNHPGAPLADGGVSPADHHIMDLFWMPVVEPYAISDAWSTAGKINMNFQIVPFNYINRATGLYAAMKGELITAIPTTDSKITDVKKSNSTDTFSSYKEFRDSSKWPNTFHSEQDKKYWHRFINLQATTDLMKARMDMNTGIPAASRGLFRTASQICEVHLVPQTIADAPFNVGAITPANAKSVMATFWQKHAITGDNSRERPYSTLYPKLTTRSNTFRVYYRAQALKKARSLAPNQVKTVATAGSSTDTIIAEYRGSSLIERYLDMNATLPDYAAPAGNPFALPSLETFYRYRVLESKQFTP